MRRLPLLLLVLVGCGGKSSSSGPAWPARAGWVTPESAEEDGGESIEPRVAGAAAIETADEPLPDVFVDSDFDPAIFDDPMFTDPPPEDPPPPPADYVPEETIIIEGELPP